MFECKIYQSKYWVATFVPSVVPHTMCRVSSVNVQLKGLSDTHKKMLTKGKAFMF